MTWWENSLSIRHAAGIVVAGMLAMPLAAARAAEDAPASCTKTEFETVVDEAAAALRDLNAKNKPVFQEKLRELKDRRGWSEDQFLKEAAPLVKDTEIEVFEKKSSELLGKISTMGSEGAESPNCAMLGELHGYMDLLVATQTAKWTYMFQKLDTELGQ